MRFLFLVLVLFASPVQARPKPDFLVIGVTKCGTTSLYHDLIQHPDILGANKKEIHFFDYKYENGIKWYLDQFPRKKREEALIGEGSPSYFWKEKCANRIAKDCPETKLILILRNPVKRAISAYFYFKGTEKPKDLNNFHRLILEPANQKPHTFIYERLIGAGCYSQHLKRWLSYFPREQIHILFLEELAVAPHEEMSKIFHFLGVDDYQIEHVKKRTKATYDASVIPVETIERLKAFYAPYDRELEQMLGRKLPWSDQ